MKLKKMFKIRLKEKRKYYEYSPRVPIKPLTMEDIKNAIELLKESRPYVTIHYRVFK